VTLRLFVVGLVTLLGQVVLLREIVVASYGSELIYLFAIGIQLLGTAAGVALGRNESRDAALRVRTLFLVYAILLPALVAFVRASRIVVGGTPGAYLPFGHQLATIAFAALPLGLTGGLLFCARRGSPLAASRFVSPPPPDLFSASLLLLGAGLLTGALFAFASLWRVKNQGDVIAPLYAADLVGGSAGSLVASLVLLPLAGIPLTLLLLGAGAILAIALL
jgi:hypothetical protein